MKIFKEFKEFAMRGNVMDMAVGVIMGGAFSSIISSLVGDVIMPFLSIIIGKIDLKNLSYQLEAGTEGGEPIILKYGLFLQNIINFLLIAFSIFIMVKVINNLKPAKPEEPKEPEAEPEPTKEEILLSEIRDILKEK